MRTQVGDIDPGQDQESRVVDHEGKVLLALLPCPSDEVVARGELPRGGGEAEHGAASLAVVDGVAHLGADQGLVSEIVVAGDELVPELALPGAAHDGAQVERTDLVEGRRGRESGASVSGPKTIGRGRFCRPCGAGRAIRASLCMASMATLAIMSLRPPSGLNQPMRRQNSFDSIWRFNGGGPAISARSSAISPAVKSRP